MLDLIEKNRDLQAQYDALNKEYQDIKQKIDTKSQELKERKRQAQKIEEYQQKQKALMQDFEQENIKIENEILLRRSHIAKAKEEMLDLMEQERLLKLQVSDLLYAKREKEVAFKHKKLKAEEATQDESNQLTELKKAYERILEQERQASEILKENESASYALSDQIRSYRIDNKQYQRKVVELKKKIIIAEKEVEHFKTKKRYLEQSMDFDVKNEKEQNDALQKEVARLEEKHAALEAQVRSSLSFIKTKKKLVEQIVAVDKENQRLRQQIIELRETIKKYKP